MRFIPLPEWGGIDLDDGALDEGVGTDQLVVGRVVDDRDDTRLAGDSLGSPSIVACATHNQSSSIRAIKQH